MTPSISIIIPMYNAEKYIGECLDSILAQTFTDYEVIVVDDCSTDKSCDIVESYQPKFGGRLQLVHTEKNSGCAGVPRNEGMKLARGKYFCFVDSDDGLIDTALDELFNAAENFQADVVHCERFYFIEDEKFTTDKNSITPTNAFPKVDLVTTPTLLTENINERIDNFLDRKFDWSTWNQFIRRDFIKQYDLQFPSVRVCEDTILAICFLCVAKKILRVPNVVYVYRRRKNSVSNPDKISSREMIQILGGLFFRGFTILEKFFNKYKILNTARRLSVFAFFANWQLPAVNETYEKNPVELVDEFVRKEIEQAEDITAPAAFFFDYLNLLQLNFNHKSDECDKAVAIVKKQRALMNYQRVQVQNLKSVLTSDFR